MQRNVTDPGLDGDDVNTMRAAFSVVVLCVGLFGCDVPKSVGDEDTTSGGNPTATMSGEGSGVGTTSGAPGSSAGVTSGWPGTASATSTSGPPTASAGVTTEATGGPACGFDLSPEGGDMVWECFCSSCTLTYEGLLPGTLQVFEDQNLCECLCPANGCGGVEGEGGLSGADPTDTGGATTDFTGTDTDWGTTTGAGSLTYAACVDQGGVIVGDPGDGSVFEPDYECPGGEAPLGWLEFEPGMPFPRNGGVCCPPEA